MVVKGRHPGNGFFGFDKLPGKTALPAPGRNLKAEAGFPQAKPAMPAGRGPPSPFQPMGRTEGLKAW